MSTCKFPTQGSYIRDAVDGTYTAYRVGSLDEHRFWKIVRPVSSYTELVKCFYLTPESYEKECKLQVGETEKHLWYADRESYNELELELSSLK